MKKIQRTIDEKIKIILSYIGAYTNLVLLENELLKKETLPIPQYVNYLSQVALCIELGMKSIILNQNDMDKTHDLKELYNNMPDSFHEMFEKVACYEHIVCNKETIDNFLEEIKNIFEEFRYMNLEHFAFFLDKSVVNKERQIIVSEIKELQSFKFILILLDEIREFHEYLDSQRDKSKDVDKILENYLDEINVIQSNTYVFDKGITV